MSEGRRAWGRWGRLAAACLMLPVALCRAEPTDIISPIVSYQYEDPLATEGTTLISPVVSYQYYDWIGDGNVTFQNSPAVSYFYNGPPRILTQPQPQVVKTGETATFSVTVEGSTPLTYQWKLNEIDLPNTNSEILQIPNAQIGGPRNYSVLVTNPNGSATSFSASLTVYDSADGPPPAAPTTTLADIPLPPDLGKKPGAEPTNANLISLGNSTQLDPARMTVVMTHGWNASPESWANEMGALLKQRFPINIVAWDWRENAKISTVNPALPASRTLEEGTALGQALMDTLGPDYGQPIHFIGHSLGTFVNCAAANYVHGDVRPRGDNRGHSYSSLNTHMTLLDEASLVKTAGALHLLGDLVLGTFDKASRTEGGEIARGLLQNVIPRQYRYVDAYSSEVGLPHAANTNVLLWRRHAVPGIQDFFDGGLHAYAYDWYMESIKTPRPRGLVTGTTQLGHACSFENGTIGLAPSDGAFFRQSLDPLASPLAVVKIADNVAVGIVKTAVLYPTATALQGLGGIGTFYQNATISLANHTGSFYSQFFERFSAPAGLPIYSTTTDSAFLFLRGLKPAGEAPQASYSLEFIISPEASQPSQFSKFAQQTANAQSPNSIYSIIPTHVPREAVAVSFEFSITGGALNEFMTMGIGEANNFTMETKFVEDGAWNSVPAIPVIDFSDQDIDLIFALNGEGVAPTGSLGIRNIQFYIPQRPSLLLEKSGANVTVSWPLSAVGWSLETSGDLGAASWLPETASPTTQDFFNSLTFDPSAPKKGFFRLRK